MAILETLEAIGILEKSVEQNSVLLDSHVDEALIDQQAATQEHSHPFARDLLEKVQELLKTPELPGPAYDENYANRGGSESAGSEDGRVKRMNESQKGAGTSSPRAIRR